MPTIIFLVCQAAGKRPGYSIEHVTHVVHVAVDNYKLQPSLQCLSHAWLSNANRLPECFEQTKTVSYQSVIILAYEHGH